MNMVAYPFYEIDPWSFSSQPFALLNELISKTVSSFMTYAEVDILQLWTSTLSVIRLRFRKKTN